MTSPKKPPESAVERAARVLLEEHDERPARIIAVSSEEIPGVILWVDTSRDYRHHGARTTWLYLEDGKVDRIETLGGFVL